jgi:hypothetical protein
LYVELEPVVFPDVVVEFEVPVGFCRAYGEAKTGTANAETRITIVIMLRNL